METMESPLLIAAAIGVIISVLKNFPIVDSKWYPFISISLGIVYYLYWMQSGQCNLVYAIHNGIIAGGTAAGIYRGIKGVSNGNKTVDALINPFTFNRDNDNILKKIKERKS